MLEDLNLSFKMDTMGREFPFSLSQFDLIGFARELTADVANNPKASYYDLAFQCQEEKIYISADLKLLRRAVLNLIMNAIQHNSAGTEVTVKVQTADRFVMIEIKDNGLGMSPLICEHIFERYFREKQNNGVNFSGDIGLSVVKSIIQAHHGSIECNSTEGKGSTFRVLLPNTNAKNPFS